LGEMELSLAQFGLADLYTQLTKAVRGWLDMC
jgi:hypothetical protein